MSSHQEDLCSRILHQGCLADVLDAGITEADFTTPEGRAIWSFIMTYATAGATRGSVPDLIAAKSCFPSYVVPPDRTSISTQALCHNVRRDRIQLESCTAIREANNAIANGDDPVIPLTRLQAQVSSFISLASTNNADVTLLQGLERVRNRMELQRAGVDLSIMRFPWEAMNRATLGLQADDYIVLYGRPKSMKTWTLAYIVSWCYEHDKRLVLYTKEMTPDNIIQRIVACICRIHYSSMRDARDMTDGDWAKINSFYDMLRSDPTWATNIITLNARDAPPGGDNVSWLHSKLDKHKPALCVIDGLYLMSDQHKKTKDNERVMSISRDIRGMVLNSGIPVIATMQANRKASGHSDANLDEIAYSDALSQDCTAAIRTIQRKEFPTEEEKLQNPGIQSRSYIDLIFGGSREYTMHGIRLNAVPAVDFTQVRELTEADALASKEADAEMQDARKPRKRKSASGSVPTAGPGAVAQAAEATANKVNAAMNGTA